MRISLIAATVWAVALSAQADDQPTPPKVKGRRVTVYQLKHISPVDAAAALQKEFSNSAGVVRRRNGVSVVVSVPDKTNNTLLVSVVPDLAETADFVVKLCDMSEFHRCNPRPPNVICCVLRRDVFTESLELSRTVNDWISWKPPIDLPAEEVRILECMNHRISIDCIGVNVKDTLRQISRKADINIWLDSDGLRDVGLSPESPVTLKANKTRLDDVLDQLLAPRKLVWTVEDEVLKITSARLLKDSLHNRVYPVPDLLASVKNGTAVVDFDSLVRKIRKSVHPESWEARGGNASVEKFESKLSLVIRQSSEGHKQIAALLKELRTKRAREVE